MNTNNKGLAGIDLFELLHFVQTDPDCIARQDRYEAEQDAKRAHEAKRTDDRYRCRRCSGLGVLEQYRRVNGGTCFRCSGSGIEEAYERPFRGDL